MGYHLSNYFSLLKVFFTRCLSDFKQPWLISLSGELPLFCCAYKMYELIKSFKIFFYVVLSRPFLKTLLYSITNSGLLILYLLFYIFILHILLYIFCVELLVTKVAIKFLGHYSLIILWSPSFIFHVFQIFTFLSKIQLKQQPKTTATIGYPCCLIFYGPSTVKLRSSAPCHDGKSS